MLPGCRKNLNLFGQVRRRRRNSIVNQAITMVLAMNSPFVESSSWKQRIFENFELMKI